MPRPSLLLVSDPTYPARGRRYGDEDAWLAARLREHFDVAACDPRDAEALMDRFDLVLVRNSGAVVGYRAAHESFRAAARARGTRVVNPVHGRGDQAGKGYLVALTAAGEPVIPTVDRREDLHRLPVTERYVVKPIDVADSMGLRFVARDELERDDLTGMIVQPEVDIAEEVSFVFVGDRFVYALRTTDARWALAPFDPSPADLAFARRFVAWNSLAVGVQRVDGCRTADGELLLVELEDLNPYLSLDVLDDATRDAFVAALVDDLHRALEDSPS